MSAGAWRSVVRAGAVPVVLTVAVGASVVTGNSWLVGVGGVAAVVLVRSATGSIARYEADRPAPDRRNVVLASRSYLEHCARGAGYSPRAVIGWVWGLWAPLAIAWVALCVRAGVDLVGGTASSP